jgi:hypothetical protein
MWAATSLATLARTTTWASAAYQIGPFASNSNVQVLITSNTSALCNTTVGHVQLRLRDQRPERPEL